MLTHLLGRLLAGAGAWLTADRANNMGRDEYSTIARLMEQMNTPLRH